MSKASVSYADINANLLKDPEVKTEYDALEPRYQAIRQIIQARNDLHITQAELAKRIGTSKSNISRLESGNYNPSLDMLTKIAKALGKNLEVQLQ